MRKGVLPNLAHLELCASEGGLLEKNVVQQLADALLELAAKGTPSALEGLKVSAQKVACLFDELTSLFKARALPRLTSLDVIAFRSEEREPDDDAAFIGQWDAAFIGQWTVLGERIGLEKLRLSVRDGLAPSFQSRMHEAIRSPAFCPRLRLVEVSGLNSEDVKAALDERWLLREEALAREAPVLASGIEDDGQGASEARLAAVERRSRELEEQNGRLQVRV